MRTWLERCTEQHRKNALAELTEELREFSHDGLTQLLEDLRAGEVIRGSWAGCVVSYRAGSAGSARRDRLGRSRNAFTVQWDGGWLTDEEVAEAVRTELAVRAAAAGQEPGRAPVHPIETA